MEFRSRELYADLYENPGKPVIVVIGGSDGGMPKISEALSGYLRARYSVLVLAYFGVGDLPKYLERIPIEYFIHALDAVKSRLGVTGRDISIIGNSKGGELALLLIGRYVKINRVIACVPSRYVWQAIPHGLLSILFPKSSWSFNGRDLPFVKFKYDKKVIAESRNGHYSPIYEKALQGGIDPRAVTELGGFSGKSLLLSAENDRYWPSRDMCRTIADGQPENFRHEILDLKEHRFLENTEAASRIIEFLEEGAN